MEGGSHSSGSTGSLGSGWQTDTRKCLTESSLRGELLGPRRAWSAQRH